MFLYALIFTILPSHTWASGVPLKINAEQAQRAVYSRNYGHKVVNTIDVPYVAPNEHLTHLFSKQVKNNNGVLISVGSFRVLHLAAMANFKQVVFFDSGVGISIFNKINLELIRISRNRFEYLSYLALGKLDPVLLSNAKNGKISLTDYLSRLRKALTTLNVKEITHSWGNLIKNYNEPFSHETSNVFSEDMHRAISRPTEVFDESTLTLELGKILEAFNRWVNLRRYTIAGSDQIFNYWKSLLDRNGVSVVVGDLTSIQDMKELGNALNSSGEKVVAIDLSNSLNYAIQGMPNMSVLDNLSELPWDKKGRVFLTFPAFRESASTGRKFNDGWDYYAFSLEDASALQLAFAHGSKEEFYLQTFNRRLEQYRPLNIHKCSWILTGE